MKKALLIGILAGLFGMSELSAQTTKDSGQAPPPKPLDDWTIFQLAFFPYVPGGTIDSNVFGMKLGVPATAGRGRVFGIEPSFVYSGTRYIEGIQAAWIGAATCEDVNGLQAAGGVCVARNFRGIQASGVCVAKTGVGFQASAANITETFTGFQIGGVNVVDKLTGVQLGIVNYSENSGCQFGFLNIIRDGWLPVSLVFNISF